MKLEKSCGAVIFKDNQVLLIKSVKGHWSFPKGHVENDETELETANREILEETNVKALLNVNKKVGIRYSPFPGVLKDVIYFYGTYESGNILRQVEEVDDIGWFDLDTALKMVTFDSEKEVLIKMIKDDI